MKTNNVAYWLVNGCVGLSSKFMVAVYLGLEIEQNTQYNYPRDPSDLNKCRLLLINAPEVRDCFDTLRTVSYQWAFVVDNWDYMISIIESDFKAGKKSSPELYEFMKSGGV